MTRYWTCRGCKERMPRRKAKCPTCGKPRPKRPTAAQKALVDPYDVWVEKYGATCNICGCAPSARRRLDRDHDHRTLRGRGLLCQRCNRALTPTVTVEWMQRAIVYLEAAASHGMQRAVASGGETDRGTTTREEPHGT